MANKKNENERKKDTLITQRSLHVGGLFFFEKSPPSFSFFAPPPSFLSLSALSSSSRYLSFQIQLLPTMLTPLPSAMR